MSLSGLLARTGLTTLTGYSTDSTRYSPGCIGNGKVLSCFIAYKSMAIRNNSTCASLTTFTPELLVSLVGSYNAYAVRFLLGKENHMGILHFGDTAPEILYHPCSQPLTHDAIISRDSLLEIMLRTQYRTNVSVFLGKFPTAKVESLALIVIRSLAYTTPINPENMLYHWCGRFTVELVKHLCGHAVEHTLSAANLVD
ncbi:hypothetical protein DL89DRAFT_283569, partial [Linderina pennispora]